MGARQQQLAYGNAGGSHYAEVLDVAQQELNIPLPEREKFTYRRDEFGYTTTSFFTYLTDLQSLVGNNVPQDLIIARIAHSYANKYLNDHISPPLALASINALIDLPSNYNDFAYESYFRDRFHLSSGDVLPVRNKTGNTGTVLVENIKNKVLSPSGVNVFSEFKERLGCLSAKYYILENTRSAIHQQKNIIIKRLPDTSKDIVLKVMPFNQNHLSMLQKAVTLTTEKSGGFKDPNVDHIVVFASNGGHREANNEFSCSEGLTSIGILQGVPELSSSRLPDTAVAMNKKKIILIGDNFDSQNTSIVFKIIDDLSPIVVPAESVQDVTDSRGNLVQEILVEIPNHGKVAGEVYGVSNDASSNTLNDSAFVCNMLMSGSDFQTAGSQNCTNEN